VSALAPTLQAFFTDRLIRQRQVSPHTIAAYRDAFRLLLGYLTEHRGKGPATLDFEDLDAATIGGFLTHLEEVRGVSVATRNARLAAVHSLFAFAALRHPEHAELIARVLAIPAKRGTRALVTFLSRPEIDVLLVTPRPHPLDRPARPHPAHPRHPDRPSGLRTHRVAKRGRDAGTRRPPASAREGTQRADHPTHQSYRHRPAGLVRRARRNPH